MKTESTGPVWSNTRWLICLSVVLVSVLHAERHGRSTLETFFPFVEGTALTFDGPVESGQTWYLDRVTTEAGSRVYHFWVVERDVSGQAPSWWLLRPQVIRVSDERVYLDELCLLRQPVRVGGGCTSSLWGQEAWSEVVEATPEWVVVNVTQLSRDRSVAAKLLAQYVIAPQYGITGFHFAVDGELGWQRRYWLTGVGMVVAGPSQGSATPWIPELMWQRVERRVRPKGW